MLVPGAGQLYSGARRRGLALLGITVLLVAGVVAIATAWPSGVVDRRLLAALLAIDLSLLALRLFAVVDAARGGWALGLATLAVLTAAPHLAAGYVTVRGYSVLERVFADEEPDGGGAEGASALKLAVSNLLGIRVDYYALVNLLGFADLVDALGGVRIAVKERLVDEVTRPAWGERKPRIDVVPGRTYHVYGRDALAYVRSRKASSDYTRMARQRCFLSALADQLNPVRVLRNFGSLAKTVEMNVTPTYRSTASRRSSGSSPPSTPPR